MGIEFVTYVFAMAASPTATPTCTVCQKPSSGYCAGCAKNLCATHLFEHNMYCATCAQQRQHTVARKPPPFIY